MRRGGCKPGVAIFEVVFRIRLDFNGFQKRGSKAITNVRFKSYQKIKPFFKNFQKKIRTGDLYWMPAKEPRENPGRGSLPGHNNKPRSDEDRGYIQG